MPTAIRQPTTTFSCSVAKTLVPTIVVNTTTGIPKTRLYRERRVAMT
jgi:hypothetical protein